MSIVPRDDLFFKHVDGANTVLIGRELHLDKATLLSEKNLFVYADTVRARGAYVSDGANIFCHCREFICEEDAKIDVSGASGGGFVPGLKPPMPGGAGQSGKPGQKGDNGKAGGTIIIAATRFIGSMVLTSRGGAGGRGQDGGDGMTGSGGPDGSNGTLQNNNGSPGQPGQPGGDAGKAGDAGPGGSGGTVQIFSTEPIDPAKFPIDVSGGDPGPLAMHGNPAPGGPGGRAGIICKPVRKWVDNLRDDGLVAQNLAGGEHEKERAAAAAFMEIMLAADDSTPAGREIGDPGHFDGQRQITVCDNGGSTGSGAPGPVGRQGADLFGPPASNAQGGAGQQSISPVSSNQLGSFAIIESLQLLLKFGEDLYRDGSYGEALPRLTAASAMASGFAQGLSRPTNSRWPTLFPPPEQTRNEAGSIARRATALITKMAFGLDFYGHAPDYVPNLTIKFYQDHIDRLLKVLPPIEEDYVLYHAALEGQKDAKTVIVSLLEAHANRLSRLDAELTEIARRQGELAEYIVVVAFDVEVQKRKLLDAAHAFEEVIRQEIHCGLVEVVKVIAAIIAVAYGAYAVAAALVATIDTAGNVNGDNLVTLSTQLKKVFELGREVSDKVADLKAKYQEMIKLIEQSGGDEDSVKILTSTDVEEALVREQLQKVLAEHDNAQARQLRIELDVFRSMVKAKNNALLEQTAQIIKYIQAESESLQIKGEIERVKSTYLVSYDPTLPAVQALIKKAYGDAKNTMSQSLYDLGKAYQYWAIAEPTETFGGQMSEFRNVYADLLQRIGDATARIGPGQQEEKAVTFSLKSLSGTAELDRFKASGKANFAIDYDKQRELSLFWNVLLKEIRVFVEGAKVPSGDLAVHVLHNGVSQRIGPQGKKLQFRHAALPLRFSYRLKTGEPLTRARVGGGDGNFIAVSPIASWRISADKQINPGVDLSQVRDVRIECDLLFNVRL